MSKAMQIARKSLSGFLERSDVGTLAMSCIASELFVVSIDMVIRAAMVQFCARYEKIALGNLKGAPIPIRLENLEINDPKL